MFPLTAASLAKTTQDCSTSQKVVKNLSDNVRSNTNMLLTEYIGSNKYKIMSFENDFKIIHPVRMNLF